jgi:ABC-type transport system involved in cytochrome c biogenesis permease subunit
MVSLAFPLLTIGFLAGAIRAFSAHLPVADMHTAMALVTWAVLGIYLFVHASAMGRGVRANYILLLALLCAVLTYMFQNQMHHFA